MTLSFMSTSSSITTTSCLASNCATHIRDQVVNPSVFHELERRENDKQIPEPWYLSPRASSELCRCKRKAKGEIGSCQTWVQATPVSRNRSPMPRVQAVRNATRKAIDNKYPICRIRHQKPTTKSRTSSELYRCKRKAKGEIGSRQTWAQMTTVS